jgi:hypothetical protein
VQEYRGHFKGGERHGHGIMQYSNGSIFDGEWDTGKKNGLGSWVKISQPFFLTILLAQLCFPDPCIELKRIHTFNSTKK